jgi:hypothetical protein
MDATPPPSPILYVKMFLFEVVCLILLAGLHLYTTEAAPVPTGPITSLSALAAGVIEVGLIAKALIIKGKYIMLTYLPSNALSSAMDLNFDAFFLTISFQREKLSI